MTHEEYIDKTRPATNFLMHVFDTDMVNVATTAKAQADQDTRLLIMLLGVVRGQIEHWIEELKAMEE